MSPIDRFLRLFSDVRPGETATALLLASNVFIILTSYNILKVLREPLILAGGGAEVAAYATGGQALLLLGAVPLYGALATRLPRRRLINVVTMFFVACLVVFFALAQLDVPLGVPFFLWVGIFNLMIVAQAWAFANDVYTEDEGKRLFPIVGFGASAGAVVGAGLPALLVESLGLFPLMLVAAALLVLSVMITNATDTRERRRTEAAVPDILSSGVLPAATGQYRTETGEFKAPSENYQKESGTFAALERDQPDQPEETTPGSTGGAFQLVFRNRYLLLIALLVLLLNWVNTTGEFILRSTVTRAAADAIASGAASGMTQADFITAFYSRFGFVVNLAAAFVQLFVVSRVIKYLGIRVAILILPVIAFAGYAILAFVPILSVVRWAKTAENATDYSLNNTVRNILFLPTTREEKYKAKQAIDAFFHRAGDLLQAGFIYVGTTWLALSTQQFALVNLGLVCVWLAIAVVIGRRYVRLALAMR